MAKRNTNEDRSETILSGLSTKRRFKVINDVPIGQLTFYSTILKYKLANGDLKTIEDPVRVLELIQTKYDELYGTMTPRQLQDRDAEAARQISLNTVKHVNAYGASEFELGQIAETIIERFVLSRLPMVPDSFEISGVEYFLSTEKVQVFLSDIADTVKINNSAGITLPSGVCNASLQRFRTNGYMPLREDELDDAIDYCMEVHQLETEYEYMSDDSDEVLYLSIFSAGKEVVRIVSQDELSLANNRSNTPRRRGKAMKRLLGDVTSNKGKNKKGSLKKSNTNVTKTTSNSTGVKPTDGGSAGQA